MTYVTKFNQNVTEDANNTSSSALNAGVVFTGTATSTLGVAGIQVSLKTDQNSIVYVDQAPSNALVTGKGTASTNDSTTLTGVGTEFTRVLHVGDTIVFNSNQTKVVASITSDTVLDVTVAFSGGALNTKAYTYYPWDISDSYTYLASIDNFGITVQAVNAYVRVRVLNNSTVNQSYLRLQTCLCPIIEAVPRALDTNGNLKTSIKSFSDEYGFSVENTPSGEMKTVIPTRLVGANFEGTTIDSNFWTTAASGTGSIAQAGGQIVLTPGANTATVTAFSVRRARYIGGCGMRYRAVVRIDAGTANNIRNWGIGYGTSMPTVTDGAWFQMSTTTFSIVTMTGSSATTVSSGSFNGTLGATYNPGTTVKTYEIYWTNSKVYFVIGNQILHTVSANTTPWAGTMNHHIYMSNVNAGAATSALLECRTATIYRLGQINTQSTSKYQTGTTGSVYKYGLGILHSIAIGAAANGAVITIYDNTAASGTVLWSSTIAFPGGGNFNPASIDFKGLPFFIGLYVNVTTASATITTIYE